MAGTKDIREFMDNLQELERRIELGYINKDIAYKRDVFARVEISAGATPVLVASFNNDNPFLDTPTNLYLASDSVNDTFDVYIEFLDQDRIKRETIVSLTGTTPINLGSNIYCIERMFNLGDTNQDGTRVVITSNATGIPANDNQIFCEMIVTSTIPANQSFNGFVSVPANYTAFITKAYVTADKGSDVKAALFSRSFGGVFRFVKALETFQQQSQANNLFDRSNEKTDLKPLIVAPTGGGLSYVDYTLLFVHNDYVDRYI